MFAQAVLHCICICIGCMQGASILSTTRPEFMPRCALQTCPHMWPSRLAMAHGQSTVWAAMGRHIPAQLQSSMLHMVHESWIVSSIIKCHCAGLCHPIAAQVHMLLISAYATCPECRKAPSINQATPLLTSPPAGPVRAGPISERVVKPVAPRPRPGT